MVMAIQTDTCRYKVSRCCATGSRITVSYNVHITLLVPFPFTVNRSRLYIQSRRLNIYRIGTTYINYSLYQFYFTLVLVL